MTTTVDVSEVGPQLSKLLEGAKAGNEIIISKSGIPVARVISVDSSPARKARIAGLHRGSVDVSEDFDAPLPDEFWLGTE